MENEIRETGCPHRAAHAEGDWRGDTWEEVFQSGWEACGAASPGWTGAQSAAESWRGQKRLPIVARLRAWSRYARVVLLIGAAVGAAWFGSRQVTTGASANESVSSVPASSGLHGELAGTNADSGAAATLQVDVHGDVRRPGLVTLQEGARVRDAVRAAGGFVHAADAEDVNQAALVWDGEEIDIPAATTPSSASQQADAQGTEPLAAPARDAEAESQAALTSSASREVRTRKSAVSSGQKIDINTADVETLETLPGVGPKRAAAIVAYRQAHGPFPDLESLRHVKGIGAKTLAKWRDLITFGGVGQASDAGHREP
ncbi:ComEA family DNA-binding protein [Alicyclobacillus fructus]|uniref:ComEA family DNA-binding protein n=1 Tax=Alicyclobacillus fructus TaxID=2816082 RepID=UPI001A90744A|nr:ComEA family DNA-binding protein [Alicyclobacillus fructus]